MNFESVEKVAAAILYEGYILYPYRPSAIKNRQRWNFGTLYPQIYAEAQRPPEPFRLQAECLARIADQASVDIKIRFLQLVERPAVAPIAPVAIAEPNHSSAAFPPPLDWDEAVERAFVEEGLPLGELLAAPLERTIRMEQMAAPGAHAGLRAAELELSLAMAAHRIAGGLCKLRLELRNITSTPGGATPTRREALPKSFVSAHVLLGVQSGEFISLLDPTPAADLGPEMSDLYRDAAAACVNTGVFPVLAGEEPDRSMMLCSPIILYDYPKIAPESAGDFFDGTEMDEMLTLRVLTLTDAEKDEMRRGDPRGRSILERTEALSADFMLKAHGVIRAMRSIREGGL